MSQAARASGATAPSKQSGSTASGVLVGLLIGALMGAMAALPLANNARHRNAYPRGLMALMEHDLQQALDAANADGQCTTDAQQRRIENLTELSRRTPAAFHAEDDAGFVEHNDALLAGLEDARRAGACVESSQLEQVDRLCEACHADYR